MALQSFNDGNMAWSCPGCGGDGTAHISHEAVQYTGEHMVALPACGCGTQTFVRVHFTDQELATMRDADGNPDGSHAIAQRHMDLHQQLQAAGKQYTGPAVAEESTTDTYPDPSLTWHLSEPALEELVHAILQKYGVIIPAEQPVVISPSSSQLTPPDDVGDLTDPQLPAVQSPNSNQ